MREQDVPILNAIRPLPESLQRDLEIDALCEKFETALKAGEQPSITDYVASAPRQLRALLEPELQGILRAFETTSLTGSTETGIRMGPYRIVEKIGEGGMGEVWLAQQEEPVRRQVAIKFMKAGLDSRSVLARFEQERQALALLDHPHIARVVDAGLTPEGRPFFVMELVKGEPLTRFSDQAKLSITDRLKLFTSICHAVQHAHYKGIVHRDLKPSNILVATDNSQPMVKIIDFGVAKAISGKLTDQSIATEYGAVVGTVEYMAPEQAGMTAIDVDTRADIYSLGVILYELLTGLRPFEARRLREAPMDERIRIVRTEDPPRPSSRLSTDKSLPATAAARQLQPAKLAALLRGDLDWIVMKCLEKDRARRYETANSIARDIERYLADEPVEARSPSAGYMLRKFVRRHRMPVLAGTLIVFTLLGAIVGISAALVRAKRAEAKAMAEGIEKQQAHAEAEARAAETASVLAYVDKHVFAAGRPKGRDGGLGKEVTLAAAVARAADSVDDSFPGQPVTEAKVRSMLGTTLLHLGNTASAERQFAIARQLFEDQLGPDDPHTLQNMSNLATSHRDQGRPQEAMALDEIVAARRKASLGVDHPDTLRSLHNLANSYAAMGRWQDALRIDKEVYQRRLATLGPDHRDTIKSMASLASDHAFLLQHDEALNLREEVLKRSEANFGPDDADTIIAMNNLASTLSKFGRHDEVLQIREKAIALMRDNVGPDHANTLMAMSNLALNYGRQNRWPDALRLHREVLELRRAKLTPDHPETLVSMYHVADTLLSMGRGDEAIGHFDELLRRTEGKPVHPRLIPSILERRIRYYAGLNDAAACRANAEQWEKLTDDSGEFLAFAAQSWSMSSQVQARVTGPDAALLARQDADRAMEWLTKAVAAGYRNRDELETSHDFEALRGRGDFQELLGRLRGK